MKRNLKILSLILAVIFITGILGACNNNANQQAQETTPVINTSTKTEKFPLTLEDSKGTKVTIKQSRRK